MATLRTTEIKERYKQWLADRGPQDECPLCAHATIQQFTLWKIIGNNFPYDRVAKVHHMLVPLRHASELQLSDEERLELLEIKRAKLGDYEYLLEATPRSLSIADHFHLHLIVNKDFEE